METIMYVTSLLTFYIKGEIKIEQNFIIFKIPNTLLGLIPFGKKVDRYPIDSIASISTNFDLKLGKLILGIIAAIASFYLMSEFKFNSLVGGLIVLFLAVNWIIDAFETNLVVTTTAGEVKLIDFLIFEKNKAERATQQIRMMISNRLSDTNVREQTDRTVDAINNNKF
ncbi:MAG: hypothetical protein J6M18_06650 [Actinomycetaceae bacterium]|nr:hypothetical protein [Actinomycetaceae bacterium]